MVDIDKLTLTIPYALVYKERVYESIESVKISTEKDFSDFKLLLLETERPNIPNRDPVKLWYLSEPIEVDYTGALPQGARRLSPAVKVSSRKITNENGDIYVVAELPRESCI